MKVNNIILTIIVIVLSVLTLWGGISTAYDVTHPQNPHNLSAWGQNFKYMTMQVCVFCHTPHGANTEVHQSTLWNSGAGSYENTSGTGSFLLWNRDIRNSTGGFTTYQSSTFQGGSGEIRVYSLMCMSCHDGVSAMNVMSNLPHKETLYWMGDDPWGCTVGGETALCPVPFSGTPNNLSGTPADIGDRTGPVSDLANDHPISFDYTTALVTSDSGLETPDSQGYVGDTRVKLFPNKDGDLVSMECSTCHDVHNYEPAWGTFLVMSNQNSGLCLNCHLK